MFVKFWRLASAGRRILFKDSFASDLNSCNIFINRPSIKMPFKRKAAKTSEEPAGDLQLKKQRGAKKIEDDDASSSKSVEEIQTKASSRTRGKRVATAEVAETKPAEKKGRKAKTPVEEAADDGVEEGKKAKKPAKGRGKNKVESEEEEDDSEGVEVAEGTNGNKVEPEEAKAERPKGRAARKAAIVEVDEDEEVKRKPKPRARAATSKKPAKSDSNDDTDENGQNGSDAEDEKPSKAPKAKAGAKRTAASSKKPAKTESIDDTDENGKEGSDSEDEKPSKASKSKTGDKKTAASSKKPAKTESNGDTDENGKEASDAEDEKPSKAPKTKAGAKKTAAKGRGQAKVESEPELDEEEEEEPKPKSKRGGKAKAEAAPAEGAMNPTETNYEELNFDCTTESPLGQTPNLRISSWNIGGIKAWVKKGGLKYLDHEKPDIFCLQEVRCAASKLPEEIADVKDYKQYWHDSDKDGYAGVGLWSLTEPLDVKYGIGDEDQDQEGRCISAEFDKYYVVSVYVPNSGRKLVTLPKRLEWNKQFKSFIDELNAKKPVIICGDMNVAHAEIDLKNPTSNTKNAGFTKEEREGFTDFLEAGYVDTFRALNPDKTDVYTFWTYMMKSRSKNVGWRLDYSIVSKGLLDNLCDSVVRTDVFGSDHCPIALFLHV